MATPKKKKNPDMPDDFTEKFDMYMMSIKPRTKLNPDDVDEMKRRFINYRKKTIEYGMEYANINCYKALGLSSDQVKAYTGVKYADNPARGDFLRSVLDYLGAYREQAIMKGYMPQIPGIFAQKNYDGMKDIAEVQHTSIQEEARDIKSIAARYQDVIDVEFTPKEKKKIPAKAGKAIADANKKGDEN